MLYALCKAKGSKPSLIPYAKQKGKWEIAVLCEANPF
jgi:hypothetical protein